MGHQRLGEIPKTKKWKKVVQKITSGGGATPQGGGFGGSSSTLDTGKVAAQILEAAEGGLVEGVNDRGLQSTFYLLTQIVLAARQDNWQGGLDRVGIKLPADATVFDLTAEIQRVLREDTLRHGRPSTIGEIAQHAASQTLAELTRDEAVSLFESGRDELQNAIKKLSTKAGFCDLGQRFFGNLTARYLDFFASKIVPEMAGSRAFREVQDFTDFTHDLYIHCYQSATIVHDFSGEWYSKTEWEKGIDRTNTGGFIAVALEKLRQELKKQREAIG